MDYPIPDALGGICEVVEGEIVATTEKETAQLARQHFKLLCGGPGVSLKRNREGVIPVGRKLRVGIVLAGGVAPGCVELVVGLRNALAQWNGGSELFGVKGGFRGLMAEDFVVLDKATVRDLQHTTGLAVIGSGKIPLSDSQIELCARSATKNKLTGLVVLGGCEAMLDALRLGHVLKAGGQPTCVLSVAKEAEGVYCNNDGTTGSSSRSVDVGYGFDSTVKFYSFLVGNLAVEARSSGCGYHFVRLKGAHNSFSVLETALHTHPNLCFIGEELRSLRRTLSDVISEMADVVCSRALAGKYHGVFLFPEAVLSFIAEVDELLQEVSSIASLHALDASYRLQGEYNKVTDARSADIPVPEILARLSPSCRAFASTLPLWYLEQVSGRHDAFSETGIAHVQVERLFSTLVADELKKRENSGRYLPSADPRQAFKPHHHYFGYESRSQEPSEIDRCLGYALGHSVQALLTTEYTGYLVRMSNPSDDPRQWVPQASPLSAMIVGKKVRYPTSGDTGWGTRVVPKIKAGEVNLDTYAFQSLCMLRERWKVDDEYRASSGFWSTGMSVVPRLEALHRKHAGQGLLVSDEDKWTELCELVKRTVVDESAFVRNRLRSKTRLPMVLRGGCRITRLMGSFQVVSNSTQAGFLTGRPLSVAVLFSGKPSSGEHNVLAGAFDHLKAKNAETTVLGVHNGFEGLAKGNLVHVTEELLASVRNQGGGYLLGTDTSRAFSDRSLGACCETIAKWQLDGVLVVADRTGLSTGHRLASILNEMFLRCKVSFAVRSAEGDTRAAPFNHIPIGFDTSAKTSSLLVSNIMEDSRTSNNRWHFVRAIGRHSSHLVVETSLNTRPNYTITVEHIVQHRTTLMDLVRQVASLVSARYKTNHKLHGVVLLPEGLSTSLSDINHLIQELNSVQWVGFPSGSMISVVGGVSAASKQLLARMPDWAKTQLFTDRDADNRVRSSAMDPERLLAAMVSSYLRETDPDVPFRYWCHSLCHQTRSSLTSNFDCDYAYVLGHLAGLLLEDLDTPSGLVAAASNLGQPVDQWELFGIPIKALFPHVKDVDKNVLLPHVPVDLAGRVYQQLRDREESWRLVDAYPLRSDIAHFKAVLDHRGSRTVEIESAPLPKL
ncbi:Pyrophosphate--fructose 6-phosphate 1-phosphotransferase subunit beta [Diplonema papillatum]|nr:Pyrophosphate--fructose 6-phosphate 1-phosphotransferase subunit beta [Diplonema papillatum]